MLKLNSHGLAPDLIAKLPAAPLSAVLAASVALTSSAMLRNASTLPAEFALAQGAEWSCLLYPRSRMDVATIQRTV